MNVPRVQGRVLNILDVTHKGFEEPALRKTRFGANVLYAPFRDEEDTDVGEFILWLNSASWVLHQALPDNDSRVLLHCYQGENRSAALAVAYACKYLQMGFADAVSAVRGPHWAPERVLNNASFEVRSVSVLLSTTIVQISRFCRQAYRQARRCALLPMRSTHLQQQKDSHRLGSRFSQDNLKVWAQITAQPPAAHARPPAAGQPRLQHRVTSRFLAYRVLRPDEVPRLPLEGITARDPASGVSLQQHLDRGSDPAFFASAFISTTADVLIACRFAVPFQRIAVIDLKHFAASGGEHYDLTTDGSRMVALHSSESGSFTTEQARLFCTRSAEILLRPGALKRLPQDCVELLEIKVTTVGREVLPGSAPAEGLPDGFPASLELLQPVAAAEEPDSSSSPSSSSADANTGFVVVELALGPGAASSAAAPRLRFTAKRGRPNVDPRQMAPLSEMSRQLQNEFAAMKMARALGLPVLDCALYTFQFTFSSGAAGGQPAWEQLRADGNNPRDDVRTAHCLVFAGDVPKLRADTLKLLAAPGGAAAAADFAQQLRADFVRDSLLGNWFVCGTARTPNVVCGPDGRLVRVDLERCLGNRYHEDGRHSVKSRSVPFGDEVLELLELRALPPHAEPPSLQHAYAEAVAALSDDDVRWVPSPPLVISSRFHSKRFSRLLTQLLNVFMRPRSRCACERRAQIADVLLSRPALLEAAAASSGVAGVSASSGAHPSSTHLVTAIENRLSYLSTVARDRSLRPGAQLLPSRVSVRLPAVSGPVARDGHSATPLPWASGSSLIFGGHGQDDVYLGDFWVHNTETSRWRQLQLDAPSGDAAASPTCSSGGSAPVTPRHSHTAVAGSNFVVVYGGLGGIAGGAFADEVVVLDVGHEGKLSRLRVVNPSGLAPPRRGRHSASLVTVPGSGGAGQKLKMFVYGGYGDAAGQGIHCRLRDFWVCDIAIDAGAEEATLEWKKIDVPKQKQPPAMHRHFSCVHDGRLYILGGAWAGGFDTLCAISVAA